MQYYRPDGAYFVGDCMPFFHDGVFRLYYLLDEGHHSALGGLGGHQWAQASSADLVHWDHHPLAIPITDAGEGSICTGSVLFHDGTYYGFYATRRRDRTQHLSLATSHDGVHFEKQQPNPFASPPQGYSPYDFRDPAVFRDPRTGLFHLLVTASLEGHAVPDRGGCLAHLVSADLSECQMQEPFVVPGLPGAPECPDYFHWRGWYYLVFSHGGVARYRMAREPLGPWHRPPVDTLDGPAARVMKTAEYAGDRHLGVAWIGTRQDDRDDGPFQFGGNAVFREMVQHPDGALGATFPRELLAAMGKGQRCAAPPRLVALPTAAASGTEDSGPGILLAVRSLTGDVTLARGGIVLSARTGLAAAVCTGVLADARLLARLSPAPGSACFGMRLRAGDRFDSGCDLSLHPHDRTVRLGSQWLYAVEGLDRPFTLEVVLKGDLIDVCIDDRRTVIERCPQQRGDRLLLYAQDAEVRIALSELVELS